MPHRPDNHHSAARRISALVGMLLVSAIVAVPVGAEPLRFEFSSTDAVDGGNGGAAPEHHEFSLDTRDKRILRLAQQSDKLRADAGRFARLAQIDGNRLTDLRSALRSIEGTAETLEIPAARWRLAYERAGAPEAADRLLGGDRERVGADVLIADAPTLSGMITALEELRDTHAELSDLATRRADSVDARAERIAIEGRQRDASAPVRKGDGLGGTWLVLPEDDVARARFNAFASAPFAWDGVVTAARPATEEQIAAVLGDPRITVYEGGRMDIATGRIDGRALDAIRVLAEQYGQITVTSLISGHSYYTAGGNVSAHSYGCAVDIGTVGGVLISASTQGPGSFTEDVVRTLAALPGDLAPHQVISLSSLGGPTLAMADHHDHIHLGYSC